MGALVCRARVAATGTRRSAHYEELDRTRTLPPGPPPLEARDAALLRLLEMREIEGALAGAPAALAVGGGRRCFRRHISRMRVAVCPLDIKLPLTGLDHHSRLVARFRCAFSGFDRGMHSGPFVRVRTEVPSFEPDFPNGVLL